MSSIKNKLKGIKMVLGKVLKDIDFKIEPAHIYTYCHQCPLRFETDCYIDWYGYAFKNKSNNERMFEVYKGDCRSKRLPLLRLCHQRTDNQYVLPQACSP